MNVVIKHCLENDILYSETFIYIYVRIYVVVGASTIVVTFLSGFVSDFKTKRRIFSLLYRKG